MLENFEVDTNIVKLRTDRFSSMKLVTGDPVVAGTLIMPSVIAGIAVNDAKKNEEVVMIYRADKIMLPCKGDFEIGAMVGFNLDDDCGCMTADGAAIDDGVTVFHAVVLEEVDTDSKVEWVLCDLLGTPVIITNDDGGS